VSGRVFFHGQPLPAGGVRFISADGSRSAFTMITEGGEYSLPHAPVGPVKVCVDTSILRRFYVDYVNVPEKYRTFKETDLTYTVLAGSQSFDISVP
jgi:hypothetical protein